MIPHVFSIETYLCTIIIPTRKIKVSCSFTKANMIQVNHFNPTCTIKPNAQHCPDTTKNFHPPKNTIQFSAISFYSLHTNFQSWQKTSPSFMQNKFTLMVEMTPQSPPSSIHYSRKITSVNSDMSEIISSFIFIFTLQESSFIRCFKIFTKNFLNCSLAIHYSISRNSHSFIQ